eukprot:TRINITY_DN2757_c1_g2_i1.p1 TRINITY_DN2757_c1_g2~~TRINITY_DN2757_c1_g2_i1.p1  ORF type:complete len:1070 (+),score=325.80 TRINITY_DN2757_c1_g2_i1:164-3373(+)
MTDLASSVEVDGMDVDVQQLQQQQHGEEQQQEQEQEQQPGDDGGAVVEAREEEGEEEGDEEEEEDASEYVLIPVMNTDEYIKVLVSELPEDHDEILEVLQAEIAPLDIWLEIALAYFKQDRLLQFREILEAGSDPEVESYFDDPIRARSQRVKLLSALAAYSVHQAVGEREKAAKEKHFEEATKHYNEADTIDIHEEITWVGKGVLLLNRLDYDRSSECFDTVLESNPRNTPALLGKACIHYHRGQYAKAIDSYRHALTTNPSAPPSVRVGMGMCFAQLGRVELAKKAFERALSLDSDCVDALVGLAVLEMNNTDNKDGVVNGLMLLKKAYQENPHHPRVLNFLANHFFYKGDHAKVQSLARSAYNATDVLQIKAESFYLLGRSFQAQSDYDSALQHYHDSARIWPEYSLALFGLGQMYLFKGQHTKAIASFEKVLALSSDNFETQRVLGYLYAVTGRRLKAIATIRRACEQRPLDVNAALDLARLQEDENQTESLKAYMKVVDRHLADGVAVSAEMWNNVGVLKHIEGDLTGAGEAYVNAFKEMVVEGEEERTIDTILESGGVRAYEVTTMYNLARLFEAQCEFTKATKLYKDILKEHPNYKDCYMRLGCMARDRAQIYEASEWFGETFLVDMACPEARLLLANLHMKKGEWVMAQKKYETILKNTATKADSFTLLSLGNLYYYSSFENRDQTKAKKALRHASDNYYAMLCKDTSNLYAANGCGIVMAENGYLENAREAFNKVLEARRDMPDVLVNLAHIYLGTGATSKAIQTYLLCSNKYYNNQNVDILLFLARAYYDMGSYLLCKKTLKRAIRVRPNYMTLWYDLSLVQLRHTKANIDASRSPGAFVKSADVKKNLSESEARKLMTDLHTAHDVLDMLANTKPASSSHYRQSSARKLAKEAAAVLKGEKEFVNEVVTRLQGLEQRTAMHAQAAAVARAHRAEKLAKEKERLEAEKNALQERAAADYQQQEVVKSRWKQERKREDDAKVQQEGRRVARTTGSGGGGGGGGGAKSAATRKRQREEDDLISDSDLESGSEDEEYDDKRGLATDETAAWRSEERSCRERV